MLTLFFKGHANYLIETSEFVQVLHNGHDHWLTVSTIGAQPGDIFVYDSKYLSVSTGVKQQIAAILCSSTENLTLKFVDVQVQTGGYDCGLFAIAFATALVHGK